MSMSNAERQRILLPFLLIYTVFSIVSGAYTARVIHTTQINNLESNLTDLAQSIGTSLSAYLANDNNPETMDDILDYWAEHSTFPFLGPLPPHDWSCLRGS